MTAPLSAHPTENAMGSGVLQNGVNLRRWTWFTDPASLLDMRESAIGEPFRVGVVDLGAQL